MAAAIPVIISAVSTAASVVGSTLVGVGTTVLGAAGLAPAAGLGGALTAGAVGAGTLYGVQAGVKAIVDPDMPSMPSMPSRPAALTETGMIDTVPTKPEDIAKVKEEEKRKLARGRIEQRPTLLTGPMGALTPPIAGLKTLLGQ